MNGIGLRALMRTVMRGLMRTCATAGALAAGLLAGGCAVERAVVARPASEAWARPQDTALGQAYARTLSEHPGQTGLAALPGGLDALGVRAALADGAQRTLDLQYYILRADATTQLLLARVWRAAQRGVRVRLLVDDLDALGKDLQLATLAAFPNIEIRVFNPFSVRGRFGLTHVLEVIGSAQRLNRRMHNKLWIADNAMAVLGGRNLGDEYFDATDGVRFTDLDVLAAGPAVQEVSRSFDAYWNSEWAVPIQAIVTDPPTADQQSAYARALEARLAEFRETDYGRAVREMRLGRAVRTGSLPLTVAPVTVLFDPPSKVASDAGASIGSAEAAAAPPSLFASRIRPVIAAARRELILISPYFIPSERGFEGMAALVRRGVLVRVLTNSLASADAIPLAHAGYARQRMRLLQAGVELHEMRPDPAAPAQQRSGRPSSGAYLHTKAIVIDRRHVVVGSMNLDPRSRLSNTEVGLLVDSSEFGLRIGQLFDEAIEPSRAFRVTRVESHGDGARLQWSGLDQGQPAQWDRDPLTSAWRRILATLLEAVAPDELL